MKKTGSLIFGSILVLIGLLFLLVNFNIIPDFSFLEGLRNLWPLGLVLSGILLIFKQRALAILVFILSITLGLFFFVIPDTNYNIDKTIEITNIELTEQVKEAVYEINFGAGELNLGNINNDSFLLQTSLQGYGKDSSYVTYNIVNDKAIIDISRGNDEEFKNIVKLFNVHDYSVKWDINLNPQVPSDINLNYGASDVNLDLQELDINNLNIECGACDTNIIFGNDTLNVHISSGASDFNLDFKNDVGIIVDVEGGLIDVNLDNFTKLNNRYISPNYSIDNSNIKIKIESGVTSISGGISNE